MATDVVREGNPLEDIILAGQCPSKTFRRDTTNMGERAGTVGGISFNSMHRS